MFWQLKCQIYIYIYTYIYIYIYVVELKFWEMIDKKS